MAAPYSNSEKKASTHANLSLPGLRKAVPRADLRAATPDTKWLEQGQRSETVAEVSFRWPILRSVPAQACAHACGQRAECFGAWPFIAVLIPFCFVRTQEFAFNEMAGESAAAHRAGNAGMRPATHTTDAAPRPVLLATTPLRARFLEGRLQSAGSKSAFPLPARFVRGERAFAFPVREHDVAR